MESCKICPLKWAYNEFFEGQKAVFSRGRWQEQSDIIFRATSLALKKGGWRNRQPQWTESLAVGSEGFVRETKERLGAKALWRGVVGMNGPYELRESLTSYGHDFGPKNIDLRSENAFFWDIST